jgi:hypothetical protein
MRLVQLSILTLLLATACAKTKPEVQEAPNGVGLTTELVEPGAEPREKLRYKHAQDLREELLVQFGLDTLLQTNTELAVAQSPVLSLGLSVKATECKNGVCLYPFEFKVIGVKMPEGSTEAQTQAVAEAVAPLSKVTGVLDVDERGITQRADVVWPTGASPRLITLLGNIRTSLITVPLPEEEVGIGAKWKVERVNQVGAIKTTQTFSYSLLERQGRILRIGVTMNQTAAPQTVADATDGASFKLETYEVSGTGSMLMNLDGITPLSEMHATSNLRGALVHGDQSEPLAAAGSLDLVVAPVGSNVPAPASTAASPN